MKRKVDPCPYLGDHQHGDRVAGRPVEPASIGAFVNRGGEHHLHRRQLGELLQRLHLDVSERLKLLGGDQVQIADHFAGPARQVRENRGDEQHSDDCQGEHHDDPRSGGRSRFCRRRCHDRQSNRQVCLSPALSSPEMVISVRPDRDHAALSSGRMHYDLTTLPNGLRVITETMPGVRSVAVGAWVDTGTRDELPNETGCSHFLEHLLFKGSEDVSARYISDTFDAMGAESNAFTSKEYTCFWGRMVDDDLDTGLGLISEMLQRPAFRLDEIDSERLVVIEEINMSEDDPHDVAFEAFSEVIFTGSPARTADPRDPGVDTRHDSRRHSRILETTLRGRIDRAGHRRVQSSTAKAVDLAIGPFR